MGQIKEEYKCALLLTNDLLGGKWKLRILWHVLHGDNRFSLLLRAIPEITQKMLTTQLRELENSGILQRKDFNENPPKVEYYISEEYESIIDILDELCKFSKGYANRNNIIVHD